MNRKYGGPDIIVADQLVITPRVFFDLVETLRQGQDQIPAIQNGVFRGITNSMPGFWTLAGVTINALRQMEATGWKGNFAKGLKRDHIKSAHSFQKLLLSRRHTYEEFLALVADYGRCVLCTGAENPPKAAGYGNTYTDADVVWLDNPICTSREMSIKTTKARVALFKGLLEKAS